MSIATYLNTGLAILGWAYIMVKTGQWITKNALRQWDKRRKESRRQKAVNEFYDAFELNSLEPGSTVRLATKGDLTIMMFRSEGTLTTTKNAWLSRWPIWLLVCHSSSR